MKEKIYDASFIFEKGVWNVKNFNDSNNFDSSQSCTGYLFDKNDWKSFGDTENHICNEAYNHDNIDEIVKGFQKSQSQNENSQHDNKYCNDSGKKVNYGQIIFKFLRHVFVVDEDDNTLE